jgi:hypothetical protein
MWTVAWWLPRFSFSFFFYPSLFSLSRLFIYFFSRRFSLMRKCVVGVEGGGGGACEGVMTARFGL